MCARTDLWEPWAGNRPGPPGHYSPPRPRPRLRAPCAAPATSATGGLRGLGVPAPAARARMKAVSFGVWAWPLGGPWPAAARLLFPKRRQACGRRFFHFRCRPPRRTGIPAGRRCCRFLLVPCPLASWPLSCYIATVRNGGERSTFTIGGVFFGVNRTEQRAIPCRERLCLLRHRRTRAGWQLLSRMYRPLLPLRTSCLRRRVVRPSGGAEGILLHFSSRALPTRRIVAK